MTTTHLNLSKLCAFFGILLIAQSCDRRDPVPEFSKEIKDLQEYFHIPGLSVLVADGDNIIYEDYLGFSDIATESVVDTTTHFPVASLTKMFTGTLILKLEEEKLLSLNDPVTKYVPGLALDGSIKIKHLLSHTSQGEVGKKFYYSSRFGLLTQVIENASSMSYEEYLERTVLAPLALENSFLLKDSADLANRGIKFAQPYIYDSNTVPGHIEYGHSASAGLVSTGRDLLTFSRALDKNLLISEASLNKMTTPFVSGSTYGLGIFSQRLDQETSLLWGYGQYDCYSSLFLKVPSENLTLILLANNNLMSDPARLINGNVTSSLFALSFIKNFISETEGMALREAPEFATKNMKAPYHLYRQKLAAEALSESFLARFDTTKVQTSSRLLLDLFDLYPEYKLQYPDINLLHTMCFLKDVSFYMGMEEFTTYDNEIEEIGGQLLIEDPVNPYTNIYMGTYHDRKGDSVKARVHFEQIVNTPNFARNWYTREAQAWLDSHHP